MTGSKTPRSTLLKARHVQFNRKSNIFAISSPEAAIPLVCARNRDLWAKLKARQKTAKSHWLLKLVQFNHNFQRTRRIKPEPGFPGSGFGFDQSPCASQPLVKGTRALGTIFIFSVFKSDFSRVNDFVNYARTTSTNKSPAKVAGSLCRSRSAVDLDKEILKCKAFGFPKQNSELIFLNKTSL